MTFFLSLRRTLSWREPTVWQRVAFCFAAYWLALDVHAVCTASCCLMSSHWESAKVTLWPGLEIARVLNFARPMERWEAITHVVALYVPSVICVGFICHVLRRALEVYRGLVPDADERENS